MKKIFIIIAFFMCFYLNCSAEVIYGNYRKVYGVYEENDEVKKETNKVYNTYEIKYTDIGYKEENLDYIQTMDDFKEEKDVKDYYFEGSVEYINKNITPLTTNSITFNNIPKDTEIYDIAIYYNGQKIDYSITYNFVSFNERIKDDDKDTYAKTTSNDSYITLNFGVFYNIRDITIEMYSVNSNYSRDFKINFLNKKTIDSFNVSGYKTVITFNEDKEDFHYFEGLKKIYKSYIKEIIVTNNYVKSGNNIILDDYKFEDNFYKRDKLILSDSLILKNYKENLLDLIIYSSDNVETDCIYDIYKNGVYQCNFKLNDININRLITVDIPENNIKINEDIDKTVNKLLDEKIETETLELKSNDIEEVKQVEEVNYYSTNNEEAINDKECNCKCDEKIVKLKNDDKDSNIDSKKKKIKNIIKVIIIILIIMLEIFLYMRRKIKGRFVESV